MGGAIRGLALACLLALAPAAQAEAPLTDAEVRGFVESLRAIESLAAREEAGGLGLQNAEDASPLSAAVQEMQARGQIKAFEAVMRRHGFADAAHWSRVGDRVYRAYFALAIQREAPGAEAEMRQALAEAERDPSLSAADKQAMREMMASAAAGLRLTLQASEADKAAVAQHMDLLERDLRTE